MPIAPHIRRTHDAAERRNKPGYIDPETGLLVLTTAYLLERGDCCGAGCRHCPYPPDVQSAAGRPPDSQAFDWHPRFGSPTILDNHTART